jgi:hypothetical protein
MWFQEFDKIFQFIAKLVKFSLKPQKIQNICLSPGDENTLPATQRHFFPIPKLNAIEKCFSDNCYSVRVMNISTS